jgi:hypothetical protein
MSNSKKQLSCLKTGYAGSLVFITWINVRAQQSLQLGGAYRDRTDDLMLAKQPLSQLS